jgi:hypothetical protein
VACSPSPLEGVRRRGCRASERFLRELVACIEPLRQRFRFHHCTADSRKGTPPPYPSEAKQRIDVDQMSGSLTAVTSPAGRSARLGAPRPAEGGLARRPHTPSGLGL